MAEVPDHFYTQSAALPFRFRGGRVEFLLLTSRNQKRWVLPKGVVEPGLSPVESALKEAWEEAGIEGTISPHSVGSYTHEKWGGTCSVQVFLLSVETLAKVWPERHRQRRWHSPQEAADLVAEPGLREILRRAEEQLRCGTNG
jgi:phosphohistidine phosphatase